MTTRRLRSDMRIRWLVDEMWWARAAMKPMSLDDWFDFDPAGTPESARVVIRGGGLVSVGGRLLADGRVEIDFDLPNREIGEWGDDTIVATYTFGPDNVVDAEVEEGCCGACDEDITSAGWHDLRRDGWWGDVFCHACHGAL